MIVYGKQSSANLEEAEDCLKRVAIRAASICPPQHDYSIVQVYRPISEQKELFKNGLTTIDGITRKGMHNFFPSKAMDIYPYLKGFGSLIPNVECYRKLLKFSGKEITENNIHLAEKFIISKMAVVAGVFFAAATIEEVEILWGTDWDNDGNFLDHNFQDYPHFQLVR